jgi:hypothetical protein
MFEYFVIGGLLLLLFLKRRKHTVSKSTQTTCELSPMDDESSENTSIDAFYYNYNVSSSKSNNSILSKRPFSTRTHEVLCDPNMNPVIIDTKSAGSCILISDPSKKDS